MNDAITNDEREDVAFYASWATGSALGGDDQRCEVARLRVLNDEDTYAYWRANKAEFDAAMADDTSLGVEVCVNPPSHPIDAVYGVLETEVMPNLRVAWRLAERAPPPVLSPAAGRAFERVGDALEHLIELISAEMIADARVKREASPYRLAPGEEPF